MKVRVTSWHGTLVAMGPGLSQLTQDLDFRTNVVRFRCPWCRRVTERTLVAGDEFEINHRKSCKLNRALLRDMAAHPEKAGRHVTVALHGNDGRVETLDFDQPEAVVPVILGPGTESMEAQQDPVSGDVTLRCPACGAQHTLRPTPGVMATMLSHARGCAWYDAYVETGGGREH